MSLDLKAAAFTFQGLNPIPVAVTTSSLFGKTAGGVGLSAVGAAAAVAAV